MALPDLATVADLSARGVTTNETHATMLKVASSVVRAAAGGPISQTTSTVTLWALEDDQWLDLPGRPVTAVTAVTVDGESLSADLFKLVDGRLWSSRSWGGREPVEVVVTMTHGLPTVPSHVVQLVCDLAIMGAATAPTGAADPRVVAERIDDYSVTFTQGAAMVASAMELPTLTKSWLRSQFGGGVGVVTQR